MKNKAYFLVLIAFLLFNTGLRSQEWEWVTNINFKGAESQSAICGEDEWGNSYYTVMTGIGPGGNYFLFKLDQNGKIVWNKDITPYFQARVTTDLQGNSYTAYSDKLICIDKDGNETWHVNSFGTKSFGKVYLQHDNIYVLGREHRGADSSVGFVSQYTYDGKEMSTNYFNVTKHARVILDKQNNIVAYHGDWPDPISKNRGRLLKFDQAGTLLFKRDIPYGPSDFVADDEGNIYIAGTFGSEPIDIDEKKFSKPKVKDDYTTHQFLIKYDRYGEIIWYKILTGGDSPNIDLKIDEKSNIFFLTNIYGVSKFGETSISQEGGKLLVSKLSSEGQLLWYQESMQKTDQNYASSESLFVNNEGSVFVTGMLKGTVSFGSSAAQSQSGMYSEAFVAKLSQSKLTNIPKNEIETDRWNTYPNPSGDIFSILGPPDAKAEFIVTDLNGRRLSIQEKVSSREQKVDLSGYSKGVYFLQIKTKDGVETKKLIRN